MSNYVCVCSLEPGEVPSAKVLLLLKDHVLDTNHDTPSSHIILAPHPVTLH